MPLLRGAAAVWLYYKQHGSCHVCGDSGLYWEGIPDGEELDYCYECPMGPIRAWQEMKPEFRKKYAETELRKDYYEVMYGPDIIRLEREGRRKLMEGNTKKDVILGD